MVLPWLLLPLQVKCHIVHFCVQKEGHAFARAYQLSGPILDFALHLYLSCFCGLQRLSGPDLRRLYLLPKGH